MLSHYRQPFAFSNLSVNGDISSSMFGSVLQNPDGSVVFYRDVRFPCIIKVTALTVLNTRVNKDNINKNMVKT